MFLLTGIGNIGEKYVYTRHNVGFLIIDEIARQYNFQKERNSFDSSIYKGLISNKKIILSKPTTFVNNSGKAVGKIASFYKIPLEKIFVFHDDLDLNLSRIKIKKGGSDAGHNGIKSIDMNIGKDYNRIRFGIGNPKEAFSSKSYVLENFSKVDFDMVKKRIDLLVKNIHYLFSNEKDILLNIISKANNGI